MSVATASGARLDESGAQTSGTLAERSLPVVLLGFAASLILSWPHLKEVWDQGTFFDTDDAMRMVQVRDWLAGQAWFDLMAHRLHPPAGLLMHWSRIVDVPVAGLVLLFERFTDPVGAERLARIVFPLALQLCLIAVTVHLGRLMAGARATLPTMVLVVLSGFAFEQFPAGRIDHHAPQITLLVTMTATMLAALAPATAWRALLTALCLAVSLGISLENLPFVAIIVAILPAVWIFSPETARRPLLWFAGGLGLFVPACYVATIPPSRYLEGACDAFSVAHLTAVLVGAAGLAGLALATPRLGAASLRAGAVAVLGAVVLGVVLATYPACLHDPYAHMDPLLVRLWLHHVSEAQPLLLASAEKPDTFAILFCPLIAGAIGSIVALARTTGLVRLRWAVILALTLVGMAGTLWEIRVSASAQPIALLGGVFVVTQALGFAQRRKSNVATVAAAALFLPFATLAWAFVPVGDDEPGAMAARAASQLCRVPDSLKPVAALPPGLVFAPIDDGSHLLAHTAHAVVAAPYHRNQGGNLLVLNGFMAAPDSAEAIVRSSGARYVAICPGEVQLSVMMHESPHGLAAQLNAGEVPSWLRPLPLSGTPYRVFELTGP